MIDDKIILQTLSMKYEPRTSYNIYRDFTTQYYNKHIHEIYNHNNRLTSTTQWYEQRIKVMYRYMNKYYFKELIKNITIGEI